MLQTKKKRVAMDKSYQVKLCYGYEQNEDGSIFHAFEAISTNECPVKKAVSDSLRETLEADTDDFNWDWMFITLPEQTVRQIRGDAIEEITLAMAKMTTAHEQDKLALLKIVASLGEKLSAAEACIDEIEDHLNRGSDNDWAQDAIARYQKFVEEQNANK